MTSLKTLEAALGYTFLSPERLRQAITHRSHGAVHNERLEFVGDAVLNCVMARALFERFPVLDEGALSRSRAGLVNRETLTKLARGLDVGRYVRLGEGELKSGGTQRSSILADALEALFGAVFLEAGYETAQQVILNVYGKLLEEADPSSLGKDAKTRLQEWLQARHLPLPEYVVIKISGEIHLQHFAIECRAPLLDEAAVGEGGSRRIAEQQAADIAYQRLLALPASAKIKAKQASKMAPSQEKKSSEKIPPGDVS